MWQDGEECPCKDGWGGINCNVCQTDNACTNFPLSGGNASSIPSNDDELEMTCYKGGDVVFQNHQMCDVTSKPPSLYPCVSTQALSPDPGIIALLPDRPPQVTFSCDKDDDSCLFQFWVDRVESFYCALDSCKSSVEHGYDANRTTYECENIKCSCIPGRFICGEAGSVGKFSFNISYFS